MKKPSNTREKFVPQGGHGNGKPRITEILMKIHEKTKPSQKEEKTCGHKGKWKDCFWCNGGRIEPMVQPTKSSEWEEDLEKLFCKPWTSGDIKSFIKSLLSSQREKFMEVIGEDEDYSDNYTSNLNPKGRVYRNEFRAELRKKTKEL